MPVSNKNFLSFGSGFSFRVKNIKTNPKREKTINTNKKRIELLKRFLIGGIKNSKRIRAKTTIKAQNVLIKYLLWNIE